MGLYDHLLFKVHILGEKVARPFPEPPNPLGDLFKPKAAEAPKEEEQPVKAVEGQKKN